MQPGNEQYGSRPERPGSEEWRGFDRAGNRYPDDSDQSDGDEWNGRAARYPAPVPKARIGLLLLLAFFVEFLIIVGGGNQWVSDKIAQSNPNTYLGLGLRNVGLVYAWRFTPRAHDSSHLWLGSLALIVTTIVLSLLLIFAIIRGPIGFGRAFFGTWMAVTVATMLGGYVRGAVVDETFIRGQGSRGEMALFGSTSPGSVVFLAGLLLGLVVAIVVGIVAPVTRRVPDDALPPSGATPTGPPPGPRRDSEPVPEPGGAPWQDQYYGPPPRREAADSERTTQLPSLRKDEPSNETTRLPDTGTALAGGAAGGAVGGAAASRSDEPVARPAQSAPAQSAPAQSAPAQAEPQRTEALPAQQTAQAEPPAPQAPPAQQAPDAAQQTTQLPRVQEGQGATGPANQPQQPAGQAGTQQFPRPPDDEDLDPEHH
jgi:hypothetical protein